METNRRSVGPLVGGTLLIAFGILALLAQIFRGFDFWGTFWPFILVAIGGLFFAGMIAGGKSVSGLAIPGTIIAGIGVMMFIQNLTNYWESWAYGWTVILMLVGLGIFIMGWWGGNPEQRRSGLGVLRVGFVLFILFGAFFEMIFRSSPLADYLFPVALILLGGYLLLSRSGLFGHRSTPTDLPKDSSSQ